MATSATNFAALIPAGTSPLNLFSVNLPLGTAIVEKIRWRVPPGPRGLMGWALFMGGVQVVPDDAGFFVIADNEYDDWDISGLPDSGAWACAGYNLGTFDHTVYLSFFTSPVQQAGGGAGNILTGFPVNESDMATMWQTGGGILV
jgi:hypothetical protein